MENHEKQIEETAKSRERVLNGSLKEAWIDGAKSLESKEYWQMDMLLNMQYYHEYCVDNGYVTPMDWIENHKHF